MTSGGLSLQFSTDDLELVDVEGERPSVGDVGQRVFVRTLDTNGNRIGTFNANTTPNDVQVEAIIDDALAIVIANVGPSVSGALRPLVRYAIIARAALSIERSFYPEDTSAADSAYQAWLAEYNAAIAAITTGMNQNEPNAGRMASIPMRSLAGGWGFGCGLLDPFNTDLLP